MRLITRSCLIRRSGVRKPRGGYSRIFSDNLITALFQVQKQSHYECFRLSVAVITGFLVSVFDLFSVHFGPFQTSKSPEFSPFMSSESALIGIS